MKPVLLHGDSEDYNLICLNIGNDDAVFLLDSEEPLYRYIEELENGTRYGGQIEGKKTYRFHVCKEMKNLDVEYADYLGRTHVDTLSDLIQVLNISGESSVTVLGDLFDEESRLSVDEQKERQMVVRRRLGKLIQQLVYLGLPLDRIHVRTEQEAKDADRIRAFEKNLGPLKEYASAALEYFKTVNISSLITPAPDNTAPHESEQDGAGTSIADKYASDSKKLNIRRNHARVLLEEARTALMSISEKLDAADDNELKLAVSALRNSGKSVVVNSMIGQILAPTALDLATPNNCIYYRSPEKNKYVLEYNGHITKYERGREEKLRENILASFKRAEVDAKNRLNIPDMRIGYLPPSQDRFTTYTIYDTPGPDLDGANHADVAKKAWEQADIVVFLIDFNSGTTNAMVEYLKQIREELHKKEKYFSLVVVVNKLDLRFINEGDKNISRVLDHIRCHLVDISGIQDIIVFGSSALTYFNCLEAPNIPNCGSLREENGLDSLEEIIDENDFCEKDMTVLNYLDQQRKNMRRFYGIRAHTLDDMKEFSGMPSLLSYIAYVGQNKARAEKINYLIHEIDVQYAQIANLFQFQKISEELARNQSVLRKAQEILAEFETELNRILDPAYPEIRQLALADDKNENSQNNKIRSAWISKYGRMTPFSIEELRDNAVKSMREQLGAEGFARGVTDSMRTALSKEVENAHRLKPIFNLRKIDGIARTILSEKELQECVSKALDTALAVRISSIDSDFQYAWKEAANESERIKVDLSSMLNNRQKKMSEAVQRYRERLHSECSIDFDLNTPRFDFVFVQKNGMSINLSTLLSVQDILDKTIRDTLRIVPRKSCDKSSGDTEKNRYDDGLFASILESVLRAFQNIRKIDRTRYDQSYFLEEVYDKHLSGMICGILGNERGELASALKPYIQELDDQLNVYFKNLLETVRAEELQDADFMKKTRNLLDTTSDVNERIQNLEDRRAVLAAVKEGTRKWLDTWANEVLSK